MQQGAHVTVDVLTTALPKRSAKRLETFLNSAGLALCLLLCFYGVRATINEFIDGTLPDKDLRIANWIILTAFVISFFMLGVEFLFRMRPRRVLTAEKESAVADSGF